MKKTAIVFLVAFLSGVFSVARAEDQPLPKPGDIFEEPIVTCDTPNLKGDDPNLMNIELDRDSFIKQPQKGFTTNLTVQTGPDSKTVIDETVKRQSPTAHIYHGAHCRLEIIDNGERVDVQVQIHSKTVHRVLDCSGQYRPDLEPKS